MSANNIEAEVADMMICCANCGIAEVDDVKLKKCNDCDLVGYCSGKCQREHLTQHEAICKERAAELRDEILFRQPESTHLGDCPICFLPLPVNADELALQSCCSKTICNGCDYANYLRELEERLDATCPFCRQRLAKNGKENDANAMKRVAANDPLALRQMGKNHYDKGEYESSFEYWTKAAELGDVDAHYNLSCSYHKGQGVEKDEKKYMYHLEEAAIAGHPTARCSLGYYEGISKRYERAAKHFIIAANLGHDKSIKLLKECYKGGAVSKEDFAAALRAYQAAVDATKSPQREAAAKHKL